MITSDGLMKWLSTSCVRLIYITLATFHCGYRLSTMVTVMGIIIDDDGNAMPVSFIAASMWSCGCIQNS